MDSSRVVRAGCTAPLRAMSAYGRVPDILRRLALVVLTSAALNPGRAQTPPEAMSVCAPIAIPRHYGPYDYVTERGRLPIVENAHFTPDVENLRRGSTGELGKDLSYTLNASPNHHRALLAAMRYAIREKKDQPSHMAYAVSCYFDRATRFRPKDTVVRGLYAKYLLDFMKQKDAALRQVNVAVEVAGDNPLTHRNAGMLYFEMGEYNKAAKQAARALELGDPREDLIKMLKDVGQWPAKEVSTAVVSPP